jgi:hypothetical protein
MTDKRHYLSHNHFGCTFIFIGLPAAGDARDGLERAPGVGLGSRRISDGA